MVTRRHLTSDYVDETVPPAKGEKWIADTEIRGFGLRAWATKSGGRKSFALRITSANGANVRRTYDVWDSWVVRSETSAGNPVPALGRLLEDARRWARREKVRLKDPDQKRRQAAQYNSANKKIRAVKFGIAAERLLSNMRLHGLSERYVDRLDKLFSTYIPKKQKDLRLDKIRPKTIAKILASESIPPHSAMTLRSFISQTFLKASRYHGPFIAFPDELAKELWPQWEKARDVRFPELRDLRPEDYKKLFDVIESDNRWQQAIAIRLYFKFRVSQRVLLKARWAHVIGGSWYPYGPHERKHWTAYEERLDDESLRLLTRLNALVTENFGRSVYFFPSAEKMNAPVATVQTVWRNALENAGLRYYPLREFSRSYRELNRPSNYRWVLEYYGPTFSQMENWAKLSKRWTGRSNSDVNSSNYR
jgi:hypothetical protein